MEPENQSLTVLQVILILLILTSYLEKQEQDGCTICRSPCRMKTWIPCSKMIKNFETTQQSTEPSVGSPVGKFQWQAHGVSAGLVSDCYRKSSWGIYLHGLSNDYFYGPVIKSFYF